MLGVVPNVEIINFIKNNIMIEQLEAIANEIANSRVRLSHPMLGEQSRQDILDEAKRMEKIESNLRRLTSQLDDRVKQILQ